MKIRLTTFARPDADLLQRFSIRYLKGSKFWKDLEFVTDNSYDKLVILTYPYKNTLELGYNKDQAITFMTEPSLSSWAKPHPTSEILPLHLHLPFLPNNFEKKIDENIKIDKSELLSVIVSELSGLPGHRARLEFVYTLDQIIDEGLDIFGRPSHGQYFKLLNNYKGFLEDKYDGLWNYKYHFACENSFENGYFTEKIIDPILTETLCFYDGCPNIKSFINPRAFIQVDSKNIRESFEIITKSIQDNEWSRRLPFIKKEKKRFMNELHPFNMIWNAVHEKDLTDLYKS